MSSLSSTNVLRHSLRRAARSTRHASTHASPSTSTTASSSQSKPDPHPSAKLPEEKMRVLVNLYHQASTFITKDTLSRRIDEAFIDRGLNRTSVLGEETPFRALEAALAQRRALPKFGQNNVALAQSKNQSVRSGQAWSAARPPRERAVMATLYGVLSRDRPAYDALKDEEERVKRELAESKRNKEESS